MWLLKLPNWLQVCFRRFLRSVAPTATPTTRHSGATVPSGRRRSATRAVSEIIGARRASRTTRPLTFASCTLSGRSHLFYRLPPPSALRVNVYPPPSQGRITAQRNKIAKGAVAQRSSAAASAASGAGMPLKVTAQPGSSAAGSPSRARNGMFRVGSARSLRSTSYPATSAGGAQFTSLPCPSPAPFPASGDAPPPCLAP